MRVRFLSPFVLAWFVIVGGVEYRDELAAVAVKSTDDPLPSWNDGGAKKEILYFVWRVTKVSGPDFVPSDARIAVFDNDGTLWSEQPMYVQAAFALDRVKALARQHPDWKNKQPFKGVLEGDVKAVAASGERGLLDIMTATHSGITTHEFEQIVRDWISTARHPTTGRLYTEMVYQPMLELLRYLRANEFKTFIVSGGGVDFIAAVDFIDDKEGKPIGIQRFIGRRPILAFGNSDGDLQMLQWTAAGTGMRFVGLVHHTDAVREAASIGRHRSGSWTSRSMRPCPWAGQ
jgi:hypothetical protein